MNFKIVYVFFQINIHDNLQEYFFLILIEYLLSRPGRILGFGILVKRTGIFMNLVFAKFSTGFQLVLHVDYFSITRMQCDQERLQLHTVIFV